MARLDFQPQTVPPQALPQCVWNTHILWAGSTSNLASQDLSGLAFSTAVASIYTGLNFGEVATISEWATAAEIQYDREALFAAYQFRYDAKMEKTLKLWSTLPSAFRTWAIQHGISSGDLYPLCALREASSLHPALLKIAGLQASRSQGVQLLERLTECALLNTDSALWTKNSSSVSDWIQNLNSIRFPQTLHRDSTRQNKLLVGWPKSFSTRWLRQGDRSGVEVKFFVSSKRELAEKISTLNRVHEGLSDE